MLSFKRKKTNIGKSVDRMLSHPISWLRFFVRCLRTNTLGQRCTNYNSQFETVSITKNAIDSTHKIARCF